MFPAKAQQGNLLLSCFSSHVVNKHPFQDPFSATNNGGGVKNFFVMSLFKMTLRHRTKMFSSAPRCKQAATHLQKKHMCWWVSFIQVRATGLLATGLMLVTS